METAYYLIVEHPLAEGRTLRTLDDYAAADGLVSDAADYEAGEFAGRWLGAIELSFDRTGLLIEARAMNDLAARVHVELNRRPAWRRRQRVLQHWTAE
jgi:hypothetical protein